MSSIVDGETPKSKSRNKNLMLADWLTELRVCWLFLFIFSVQENDTSISTCRRIEKSLRARPHTTSIHRGWPTRSLCHCSSDADSCRSQSIDTLKSKAKNMNLPFIDSTLFSVVCFSRNNGLCPTVSTWIVLHTTHTWPILWRADGGQTTSRRSNHIFKWIESIWNEVNRPSETKQYFSRKSIDGARRYLVRWIVDRGHEHVKTIADENRIRTRDLDMEIYKSNGKRKTKTEISFDRFGCRVRHHCPLWLHNIIKVRWSTVYYGLRTRTHIRRLLVHSIGCGQTINSLSSTAPLDLCSTRKWLCRRVETYLTSIFRQ